MADASEEPKVHVGDVGTLYKAKIQDDGAPFNPTAATTKEIVFQPPGATKVTKAAGVTNDGTDWYLTYTAEANFHTVAGRWKMQGHVLFGDGQEYRSTIEAFQIHPNL